MSQFRKDFIWGVGSACVQVEGASFIDGKGVSNWDVFGKMDNICYQNQTSDDGPDSYNRFKEDIALAKKLGVQAYRFSFSWTRILPNGVGKVNEQGLKFYDALIDEIIKAGMKPFATIFHWDYPFELYLKGGWLNPESPLWFLEYVKVVADRYKDKISHWVPINEPPNVVEVGGQALRATISTKERLQMVHNVLLAHGHGAKYLKDLGCTVGTALCSSLYAPYNENDPKDIEAARKALFAAPKDDTWKIALWADPIFLGKYPDEYYKIYSEFDRPKITEEDMKLISTPLDFYGQNLYTGSPVTATEDGGFKILNHPIGNPKTGMDWEVYPKIMYWAAKYLTERYKKPFYIMENGCVVTDIVSEDKKIHDGPRIEYYKQYLKQLRRAYEDGIDVRGYINWALLDNYEWFNGFQKRFGIVYVDYATKERIEKDSYYAYQEIVKTNGENL